MEKLEIYIHCDDNPTLRSWTKKIYLLEADKRLGLGIFRDFSEAKETPNYVLNIQPCDSTIWNGRKWTGLWHIDCMLEGTQFPRQYSLFDTIFLASTSTFALPTNSQILYQAADPTVHKKITQGELPIELREEYDFILSGTIDAPDAFYAERRRRLEILKKEFSFRDWGKGHSPQEYVKRLSTARVQWMQSGISQGRGSCAQRFFECLAIGPVLTNWNEDLEQLGLIEDVDYMAYKTDEEMIHKMHVLVEDELLRNNIAKNGRQKALLYHSYEQRAMAIYNTVRDFVS